MDDVHTSAEQWNERYGQRDRLWSGAPNGALVRAVTALPAGRALDLGCGEGADARWLAARGWHVTAMDVSTIAIERARVLAPAGLDISWVSADVMVEVPQADPYDLIAASYFPLPADESATAALTALTAASRDGAMLLYVGHDMTQASAHHLERHEAHRFLTVEQLADRLPSQWRIETLGVCPRDPVPVDNPFTNDVVLRARKV